jgi:hypothetical protein
VVYEGIFSLSGRFFNPKLIAISYLGFAVLIAVNFRTMVFLDVMLYMQFGRQSPAF